MPEYTYQCDTCDYVFSIVQPMSQYKPKKKCPHCSAYKLYRIYDVASVFVKLSDSEIKTVGHLAERNREKMSEDQRDELTKKHNAYKYEEPKKELPRGMSRVKRSEGTEWPA